MEPPHILLVDDQPHNLQTLLDVLEHSGYRLHAAINGMQALRLARSMPLDLILLDVMMPEMDGFETCRQLKADKRTTSIPIIFITALADTSEILKGFELGAVDYITKPFQQAEVLARVRTHIMLRQAQQQLQDQNRELHEQNTRFRALEEATFEGIVIHKSGQIYEVNTNLCRLFGYDQQELIGKSLRDLLSPRTQEKFPLNIPPPDTAWEAEGQTRNGRLFPMELQGKSLRYNGEEMHVLAVRDLSRTKYLDQQQHIFQAIMQEADRFGQIIGRSPAMHKVYDFLTKAAATDSNVVIYGESGTGKELAAQTIHTLSNRKDKPFVAVNCGAIPHDLFESEFFGHRKGAFTGAVSDKPGLFSRAHGGSLFLDEVGELLPSMQVKLLRALQEGEFIPLGGRTSERVDVRIIAATNRELRLQVAQGHMREDFFYRIHVLAVNLPPLSQRPEDIPLLITYFLQQFRPKSPYLPEKVMTAFCAHDWPGNIRELQNALQRYVTTGEAHFVNIRAASPQGSTVEPTAEYLNLGDAVAALEQAYIIKALRVTQGNRKLAAALLGIDRSTLYQKLKKFHLEA